jgi:hypothetical protein
MAPSGPTRPAAAIHTENASAATATRRVTRNARVEAAFDAYKTRRGLVLDCAVEKQKETGLLFSRNLLHITYISHSFRHHVHISGKAEEDEFEEWIKLK